MSLNRNMIPSNPCPKHHETIGGLAYVVLVAFFVVKGVLTAPFRIFRR